MKRIYRMTLLACVALLGVPAEGLRAQTVVEDSLVISGNMRHFKMFLPHNLPDNAPLVMALHGYGSEGPVGSWMNDAAVRQGWAGCVCDGLEDS